MGLVMRGLRKLNTSREGAWSAVLACCLLCTAMAVPAWASSPSVDLTLEAASGSAQPILIYRRGLGELASTEPGPTLEIYANGRMVVRRPSPMSRPGTWRGLVASEEVASLLSDLAVSGFVDMELDQLRAERSKLIARRAEAARLGGTESPLFAAGDTDISELEIYLEHYRPVGDLTSPGMPLHRSWTWSNLHTDAVMFQELHALVAFDQAEHRLIEWMDRSDLERAQEVTP